MMADKQNMSDKQNISLSTVKLLLQQQREDFSSMINSLMQSFNDRYDKLQASVTEVKVSLEYSQKDIDNLQKSVITQDETQKSISNEAAIITDNLNDISNKLDYLENQSRRNNIIFDGIPETKQETWKVSEEKVLSVLKTNMGFTDDPPIERAHRVGSANPRKTRPIVVKFLNFKDRDTVLRNGKKLRGTSVYVRDDLSEKVLARRRSQMDLLKEARQEGKIAYFNYDRLIIRERLADNLISADSPSATQSTERRTTRSQSALHAQQDST